ncbi:hypothetical protein MM02_00227 [Escherichia phage vB_EcoM_MM02]|uniref:DUF7355 domain-containing protein n=1 Tax=Escherichia phage vB_EcoM_MM02 TaxID=2508202 RepID=A0A482N0S4_9CAUD|nr:hypothetical protein MM02_00227 [Escherichia phage vB_EcoM_MM02]
MFPTYSEIVKVVFSQIIANNMFEVLDNAAELRVHAQLTHVLNALLPGQVDSIAITLLPGSAHVIVVFDLDGDLVIQCDINFGTQKIECKAI